MFDYCYDSRSLRLAIVMIVDCYLAWLLRVLIPTICDSRSLWFMIPESDVMKWYWLHLHVRYELFHRIQSILWVQNVFQAKGCILQSKIDTNTCLIFSICSKNRRLFAFSAQLDEVGIQGWFSDVRTGMFLGTNFLNSPLPYAEIWQCRGLCSPSRTQGGHVFALCTIHREKASMRKATRSQNSPRPCIWSLLRSVMNLQPRRTTPI